MNLSKQIPVSVLRAVSETHLTTVGDIWSALPGGRTNRVWKIETKTGALICKLYGQDQDNPLYPNLPGAEYEALKALGHHDLAPFPVALLRSDAGEILVYHHLDGDTARLPPPEDVARMLGRLHTLKIEVPLRRLSTGSESLVRQIRGIVAQCRNTEFLSSFQSSSLDIAPVRTVSLVHTDVVASNIVSTASGLRLIDWQCPAFGDACEDLASLLSPAMQALYTGAPAKAEYARRVLAAYPDQAVVQRYRALASLFHWRIAAYCQWKAERGYPAYGRALGLELAALNDEP